jgi:hypothetical protein
MANVSDHKDFYIRNKNHPLYEENKVIEDELINVIVQKLEMLIYSNNGDLYGEPLYGSDLEYYLWMTTVPASDIQKKLNKKISVYIPELLDIGYDLKIELFEGALMDTMKLSFRINEYNINFIID